MHEEDLVAAARAAIVRDTADSSLACIGDVAAIVREACRSEPHPRGHYDEVNAVAVEVSDYDIRLADQLDRPYRDRNTPIIWLVARALAVLLRRGPQR